MFLRERALETFFGAVAAALYPKHDSDSQFNEWPSDACSDRWRLILLSPWEEEDIASQLAGSGWYTAVGEILCADGQKPKLIEPSDWRYQWVQQTLRRLEAVIPVLQAEKDLRPDWTDGSEAVPLPPPSEFPLTPRFRESEHFARLVKGEDPHTVMKERSKDQEIKPVHGPPYSLLVVDKPEAANAFSYGFGPDGAAGIVVFSGFLDDIVKKYPFDSVAVEPHGEELSWWSTLLGGFFGAKPATRFVPSEEQTSELAILLAHEVAHLLLAHHIETLSVGSIVGPSVMNIVTDVIRAFMFPFTMFCTYLRVTQPAIDYSPHCQSVPSSTTPYREYGRRAQQSSRNTPECARVTSKRSRPT